MPNYVTFDVTREDADLLAAILKRAKREAKKVGIELDSLSCHMDLTACHANGCPLKLQALLDADGFNFVHDVWGIQRHINRTTGQLENCFLPRFAKK